VASMGKERKEYSVLVGQLKLNRQLGRPRHRWEDGIRMDLSQTGWKGVGGVDSVGSG
jgi:hypothetical protein